MRLSSTSCSSPSTSSPARTSSWPWPGAPRGLRARASMPLRSSTRAERLRIASSSSQRGVTVVTEKVPRHDTARPLASPLTRHTRAVTPPRSSSALTGSSRSDSLPGSSARQPSPSGSSPGPVEPAHHLTPHDGAGRGDQEGQADDVRQEPGRDQEGAAEDHEHAVHDLAVWHPAGRQRLVEATPDRAALGAEEHRSEHRVGSQQQDRPDRADGVPDLEDHVQLDDRDDDEERYQGRQRHSGLTLLPLLGMPTVEDVQEALTNVIDPELGLDFVELGLIYDVGVEGGDVFVTFTLTSPGCPIGPQVSEQIEEFVGELDGVANVHSKMTRRSTPRSRAR